MWFGEFLYEVIERLVRLRNNKILHEVLENLINAISLEVLLDISLVVQL